LGFIVLDGATFLLLALTVSAGVGLVAANAIKSAVILPSVLASMLVFSFESVINWKIGIILAAGSIFGGFIGARLAMAPAAKKVIFWVLAAVLIAEAGHHGSLRLHRRNKVARVRSYGRTRPAKANMVNQIQATWRQR
jgi:hypothetical protein